MNVKDNITDLEIKRLLKRFKLPDILNKYEEVIASAIEEQISYREFLYNLLNLEEKGLKERLRVRNIKNANFESCKTLNDFDFSFPRSINQDKVKDLATLRFIDKNENIVFLGPPGVGKSHLAEAIGIKACEGGRSVLFANAIDLMDNLSASVRNGTLKQKFSKLLKIDLLIIDDIGYLKMDKEKESLFFQLIRQRYEKKSLIVTTNLPFNRWDEIFTSELAAAAILDRLLHHSHVISITGDSFRVKENFREEQ